MRNNQADYLRAVLHQLPYYIPPVMFANLINILIFALMMGAVELLPNLLFTLLGSGKVGGASCWCSLSEYCGAGLFFTGSGFFCWLRIRLRLLLR